MKLAIDAMGATLRRRRCWKACDSFCRVAADAALALYGDGAALKDGLAALGVDDARVRVVRRHSDRL
jgi:fatty acid/phospholipid biosynthesis enzyme